MELKEFLDREKELLAAKISNERDAVMAAQKAEIEAIGEEAKARAMDNKKAEIDDELEAKYATAIEILTRGYAEIPDEEPQKAED